MLLSRRAIYDRSLVGIASDIVFSGEPETASDEEPLLIDEFFSTLLDEISHKSTTFKLLLPYPLFACLHDLSDVIKAHVAVKFQPTDALANVSQLREQGFFVALEIEDIHALGELSEEVDCLLVKVMTIAKHFDALTPFIDNGVALIATHVNDYFTVERLAPLNIPYYMGSFLEKPERLSTDEIAPSKTSVLGLISKLNDPQVTVDDISKLLAADNVLSYQLLKIVNSPLFRGMSNIQSVQDAVVRFGYANLKKWVLMLSLCDLGDKPAALLKLALQRAIMCAKLAEHHNVSAVQVDSYYTAGLLSTLDAFLDSPLNTLIEELALSKPVELAITEHEGEIGEVLEKVIDYQRGFVSMRDRTMMRVYIDSSREATQTFQVLGLS